MFKRRSILIEALILTVSTGNTRHSWKDYCTTGFHFLVWILPNKKICAVQRLNPNQSNWIHLYSDPSPYSECSLVSTSI